eukprot:TRINITY_DN7241_c0_g1_i1.p1 TRINITY_DN7241_c0_g1~~TRINITY_DN7241_c0_g1_i1.p1  ORF type:complete len:781 (+),score=90.05 TRINITY_DN7241_c0_g1_i1:24-2345(+)
MAFSWRILGFVLAAAVAATAALVFWRIIPRRHRVGEPGKVVPKEEALPMNAPTSANETTARTRDKPRAKPCTQLEWPRSPLNAFGSISRLGAGRVATILRAGQQAQKLVVSVVHGLNSTCAPSNNSDSHMAILVAVGLERNLKLRSGAAQARALYVQSAMNVSFVQRVLLEAGTPHLVIFDLATSDFDPVSVDQALVELHLRQETAAVFAHCIFPGADKFVAASFEDVLNGLANWHGVPTISLRDALFPLRKQPFWRLVQTTGERVRRLASLTTMFLGTVVGLAPTNRFPAPAPRCFSLTRPLSGEGKIHESWLPLRESVALCQTGRPGIELDFFAGRLPVGASLAHLGDNAARLKAVLDRANTQSGFKLVFVGGSISAGHLRTCGLPDDKLVNQTFIDHLSLWLLSLYPAAKIINLARPASGVEFFGKCECIPSDTDLLILELSVNHFVSELMESVLRRFFASVLFDRRPGAVLLLNLFAPLEGKFFDLRNYFHVWQAAARPSWAQQLRAQLKASESSIQRLGREAKGCKNNRVPPEKRRPNKQRIHRQQQLQPISGLYGLPLLNFLPAIHHKDLLHNISAGGDNFHWSDAGHEFIAQTIKQFLEAINATAISPDLEYAIPSRTLTTAITQEEALPRPKINYTFAPIEGEALYKTGHCTDGGWQWWDGTTDGKPGWRALRVNSVIKFTVVAPHALQVVHMRSFESLGNVECEGEAGGTWLYGNQPQFSTFHVMHLFTFPQSSVAPRKFLCKLLTAPKGNKKFHAHIGGFLAA